MNSIRFAVLILTAVAALTQGCRDTEQPPTVVARRPLPGPEENVKPDFERLAVKVQEDPSLSRDIAVTLGRGGADPNTLTPAERLDRLYGELLDPNGNGILARRAFGILERMQVTNVARPALLHKHMGVVIDASRSLAKRADRGMPDLEALPYLIYVLERNNYIVPGGDVGVVHDLMKRSLVNAIVKTIELGIDPERVNIDNEHQIADIIAQAEEWARRHKIVLFEKFVWPQ